MNEIPEKVFNFIASALVVPRDKLTAETTSKDLADWDSIGAMNILVNLEKEYGVKLPPGATSKLQSVRGIAELLKEAGKLS